MLTMRVREGGRVVNASPCWVATGVQRGSAREILGLQVATTSAARGPAG
jgi:transposase-like protein